MFKSIIDFCEIGKDNNVNWFVRSQNIILGVFLFAGGCILIGVSITFLFLGHFYGGIVLGISGLNAIIIYLIARKRKMFETFSFWLTCIGIALPIPVLMFFGAPANSIDFVLAGLLLVIFSVVICILLSVKRGSLFSFLMLAVYFVIGLWLNFPILTMVLFIICSLFFLMIIGALFIINQKMEKESDNKISDIQKDAEVKNEFISQLSYQIRTPLNNIVVIGNLLNDTPLNQRQKDWMETILASANNLVNVVNIIASRVSSTEIVDTKPTYISFNLQTVLNSIVQLFVGQSEDYNIGLKPSMEASHILEGDPIQIKQIFLTLIDAIIKNKKAEKINIIISYRVRQETEQLFDVNFEIRVSDHLNFDMENNKGNTEMLNYAISSKLISMSGNQLNVHHDNNFTIFNFTLSLKKAREEIRENVVQATVSVDTESTAAPSPHETSTVDLKEANILLVEDNLINQKIVILSIQKMVKKIDVANNGQEAVDKFNAAKYDIILMDIQMPIMDGIQATKKIREIEAEKRIIPTPIIAITANALAGDREHCLASGMDEYISKPFQVEVLITKMKNQLAIGSSIRHQ